MQFKNVKLFFLLLISIILIGCNFNSGENGEGKRAPIYQGMILSTEQTVTEMSLKQVINQDDPFGNVSGEKIEDEIYRKYEFTDEFSVDYYSEVNKKLYLTIKLSNPSSFEILSFTLNGTKYQSFQFEKGSDSENLILEVDSGETPGVKEFTIDEIKYVDGTAINDVVLEGNKSIKLGVTFTEKPVVVLSELLVEATSIKFNAEIGDKNGLIATAGDFLKAVLYDGEDIIQEKDLTLGKNNIEFNNLVAGDLYQYAIIAKYNLLDEKGLNINVLNKNALYTEKIFEIYSIDSTKDSVNFTLNIMDTDLLGNLKSVELMENGKVVKTLESFDVFSFVNLKSNTDYEVIAKYEYTLGDKNQVVVEKESIKTLEKVVPTIIIKDVEPTQESVEFVVDIQDEDLIGQVKSIELWQGNTFVEKLDDLKLRAFNSLYSNNNYTIIVQYEYDLNDGNVSKVIEVKETFLTEKKTAPYIKLVNETIAYEEYSGLINLVKHSDYEAYIDKIELYKDNEFVSELEEEVNLHNLLAGNIYTIKVTYTYDLNDNLGPKQAEYEYNFTTTSYKIPEINLELIDSESDFVLLEAIITDVDSVGNITSAVAKKDGKVFSSLDNFEELLFTNLYYDIKYTFEITYSYDLKDGKGINTLVKSIDAYTAPSITVLNTKVINTEKLTEGDSIAFEISVFNPQKMTFTKVMINDVYYTVSDVTTNDKIRVEFPIGSEYRGGTTEFVVQKIEGQNYNQERAFDIKDNNVGYAFVNGDIFVEKMEILDPNGLDLEYAMPGDSYQIRITFDNPTGYIINKLNIRYLGELSLDNNYTLSDNNSVVTINLTNTVSNTTYNYNLASFTYLVDETTKQKSVENIDDLIVLVKSTEYKYIYTPFDLANIESGYSYKLANDIDLTDYDWKPKDISYVVIDGNGYSINNLRNVKTYVDTSVTYGLFREVYSSILKNISINDLLFMITMNNSTTQSEYSANVGGLAAYINTSSLNNININGEINVNNTTSSRNSYVGGLSRHVSNSSAEDIYIDMIVSSSGTYYTGLFAGNLNDSKVNKIIVDGSLYSNYYTGSIAGYSTSSSINNFVINTNLYTNSSTDVGGIVGYGNGLDIQNGYVNSNIIGTQTWAVGYLFGNINNSKVLNTFAISENASYNMIGYSVELITENINLYTNLENIDLSNYSSLWDNNIWSFNEELPNLKWNPLIRIINVISNPTSINFELKEIDFSNIGLIEKIELFDSTGNLVSTIDGNGREFNSLKYNTDYTIKVTYKYNHLDGTGDQYLEEYYDVRTLPNEGSPEVNIVDIGVNSDSINFDLDIIDPNNYGNIEKVELYDLDNNLISSLNDFTTLQFTNLISNTTYRILVTYSFDLGDTYGVQYIEVRNVVRTNPDFLLEGVSILNTDALMVGDLLILQLQITNPDGIMFNKATINGKEYLVKTQNESYITFNIPLEEELGVGSINIIIEKLTGIFNNLELVYTFNESETNNKANVFVNGDVYITNMRFVDANGNGIDYALVSQEYFLELEFYNPTKYLINSININGNVYSINSINDDNSKIVISFNNYDATYRNYEIRSFNYSSSELNINKTKNITNKSIFINLYYNSDPIEIYTLDDLMNMKNGFSYKLMNNLDLSGIAWQPKPFNGIFEGNGFKISNLSIVRSYTNQEVTIGLFSDVKNSIINNLVIDNFNLIINSSYDNEYNYSYYNRVGALAASILYSKLNNIIINSNIDLTTNTQTYKQIGGLAGLITNSNVNNVYIEGSYSLNNSDSIGGLVGYSKNSTLKNIISKSNIINNGGTIAGYLENSILENSYSFGISNSGYSLFCYTDSYSIVRNSFSTTKSPNNGDLYLNKNYDILENVYTPIFSSDGNILNYENILEIMKLYWDENVWSFDNTQPMLKFLPKVDLTNVELTLDTISYDILINDFFKLGKLVGIELYEDGVLKESLEDLTIRVFSNLRYSTNYQIVLIYEYSYGGDNFVLEQVFDLRTPDKEDVPSIEITNVSATKDEITFNLDILDNLGIGNITSINLYDTNKVLVDTITDFNILKFTDLYSDYSYILEVIYTYDFDDGYGTNYVSDKINIKTIAKIVPTVDLSVNSNVDQILFNISISDLDSTLNSFKIILIDKDNQEIHQYLNILNGIFKDLDPYTNYNVKMEYDYNLNNNQENVVNTVVKQIKTSPFIEITGINVLNTEALIVGDDLALSIGINNPSNITFTKAKINGKYYTVTTQTENSLRVLMEIDKSYEGGLTNIIIEELQGNLNNDLFNINIDINNNLEIFINGDIYITNIEIVNLNNEPIEYIKEYSYYYLKITFYNPTNYTIDGLNISTNYSIYQNIITQSGNIVYAYFRSQNYDENYSYLINSINSFNYSNENITRTKSTGVDVVFATIVKDDNIFDVSTAEELQNIQSGNVYRLVNDIDFENKTFNPIDNFRGVFDGNGYTIRNISIVKTYYDSNVYIGLFGEVNNSVIRNISLENINYIISVKSNSNSKYNAYIGGLAGRINNYSRIYNINILGEINIDNQVNSYSYVGGLSGHAYDSKFENINTDIIINSFNKTNTTYLGGLIGYANRVKISNSYTKIDIDDNDLNSSTIISGLVSRLYGSNVYNSVVTGIIKSNNTKYGLTSVGETYIYNSYSTVTSNSYYLKNIYNEYDSIVKDSYSLVADGYSEVLTLPEIHDKIREVWDPNIWDFVNIDELGNPVLKR